MFLICVPLGKLLPKAKHLKNLRKLKLKPGTQGTQRHKRLPDLAENNFTSLSDSNSFSCFISKILKNTSTLRRGYRKNKDFFHLRGMRQNQMWFKITVLFSYNCRNWIPTKITFLWSVIRTKITRKFLYIA